MKRREEEAGSLRAKIEAERPRISRTEVLARRRAGENPMLRLASDADVHGDIIRGLRRRRADLDLLRAQEILPEGACDPAAADEIVPRRRGVAGGSIAAGHGSSGADNRVPARLNE
jgi:hypothetical protein